MWADSAISKMTDKTTYCRDDLAHILSSAKPDLSDSAFRWTLYNLLRERKLFRVDYDTYTTVKPKEQPLYRPYYSDKAKAVTELLASRFPEMAFVVFESVLLNEFLNHQIAQNTIYVQVERDISSYIFDELREGYAGNVLYKPGSREFDRYWTRDCVIVLDLITQAPLAQDKPYEITIEKLLVDLVAEKSIAATFSPSEIPSVYEEAMKRYRVDRHKLLRYAGRRGKADEVKGFVGEVI
jgi:hypothetical protein